MVEVEQEMLTNVKAETNENIIPDIKQETVSEAKDEPNDEKTPDIENKTESEDVKNESKEEKTVGDVKAAKELDDKIIRQVEVQYFHYILLSLDIF